MSLRFICGQFSLLVVVDIKFVRAISFIFARAVVARTGWKEVIVNLLVPS